MTDKLDKLKQIISEMESVAIAFSGGVDSSLLLKVAHDVLGDRALAVTATSETYPESQFEESTRLAIEIGARQVAMHTEELDIPAFKDNPPNRCYYCKKELFEKIRKIADEHGLRHVADGANSDDLSDHRPGSQAAAELGVRSPLQEANLTKADIRRLSKQLGLPTWNKPAFACLSSRFPYGSGITRDALDKVAAAEEFLRSEGFGQYRVRHHNTIARIELPAEDIARAAEESFRKRLVQRFKEIGYTYVTLDLQGFRSGSMNEVLSSG